MFGYEHLARDYQISPLCRFLPRSYPMNIGFMCAVSYHFIAIKSIV